MKKFAALLLALMMVLSLVPMATAEEPIVIRYGTHWTAGWNPNEIDPATGTYTMTDEADRLLRISLGLENVEDLIEDFEQAFAAID